MAAHYVVEHLNHLGIVAEVCREIGVAAWLDSRDPTSRQRISVSTAKVALVLNGLSWSNRQLYLVPQFFVDKPVEHLVMGENYIPFVVHRRQRSLLSLFPKHPPDEICLQCLLHGSSREACSSKRDGIFAH